MGYFFSSKTQKNPKLGQVQRPRGLLIALFGELRDSTRQHVPKNSRTLFLSCSHELLPASTSFKPSLGSSMCVCPKIVHLPEPVVYHHFVIGFLSIYNCILGGSLHLLTNRCDAKQKGLATCSKQTAESTKPTALPQQQALPLLRLSHWTG